MTANFSDHFLFRQLKTHFAVGNNIGLRIVPCWKDVENLQTSSLHHWAWSQNYIEPIKE